MCNGSSNLSPPDATSLVCLKQRTTYLVENFLLFSDEARQISLHFGNQLIRMDHNIQL